MDTLTLPTPSNIILHGTTSPAPRQLDIKQEKETQTWFQCLETENKVYHTGIDSQDFTKQEGFCKKLNATRRKEFYNNANRNLIGKFYHGIQNGKKELNENQAITILKKNLQLTPSTQLNAQFAKTFLDQNNNNPKIQTLISIVSSYCESLFSSSSNPKNNIRETTNDFFQKLLSLIDDSENKNSAMLTLNEMIIHGAEFINISHDRIDIYRNSINAFSQNCEIFLNLIFESLGIREDQEGYHQFTSLFANAVSQSALLMIYKQKSIGQKILFAVKRAFIPLAYILNNMVSCLNDFYMVPLLSGVLVTAAAIPLLIIIGGIFSFVINYAFDKCVDAAFSHATQNIRKDSDNHIRSLISNNILNFTQQNTTEEKSTYPIRVADEKSTEVPSYNKIRSNNKGVTQKPINISKENYFLKDKITKEEIDNAKEFISQNKNLKENVIFKKIEAIKAKPEGQSQETHNKTHISEFFKTVAINQRELPTGKLLNLAHKLTNCSDELNEGELEKIQLDIFQLSEEISKNYLETQMPELSPETPSENNLHASDNYDCLKKYIQSHIMVFSLVLAGNRRSWKAKALHYSFLPTFIVGDAIVDNFGFLFTWIIENYDQFSSSNTIRLVTENVISAFIGLIPFAGILFLFFKLKQKQEEIDKNEIQKPNEHIKELTDKYIQYQKEDIERIIKKIQSDNISIELKDKYKAHMNNLKEKGKTCREFMEQPRHFIFTINSENVIKTKAILDLNSKPENWFSYPLSKFELKEKATQMSL